MLIRWVSANPCSHVPPTALAEEMDLGDIRYPAVCQLPSLSGEWVVPTTSTPAFDPTTCQLEHLQTVTFTNSYKCLYEVCLSVYYEEDEAINYRPLCIFYKQEQTYTNSTCEVFVDKLIWNEKSKQESTPEGYNNNSGKAGTAAWSR